jgi:all-trans-retinol 13,14-reductase
MADQAWDAIVIGSGIGGLAAAAALATQKKRVLVLERHWQPGGLTQTFEREGFRFNVGVHYLGGFAPGQLNQRLFDTLTGGRLQMARIGGASGVYDRIRLPDFSIDCAPPATQFAQVLKRAFPQEATGIDRYFDAIEQGAAAMRTLFALRSMPSIVAGAYGRFKRAALARWVGRTTDEVVRDCVADPHLQALLAARWGDYGSRPRDGSFGIHAVVTKHYLDGAWYPVGGSARFAHDFGTAIEAAGGALRTSAEVAAIRVAERRAIGVALADGSTIDCPLVISDIGIRNTVRLLPSHEIDYAWAEDALALDPSLGYVGLYLGLEGDIEAAGADMANTWIYESWDVDAVWRDPLTEPHAPGLFVCFPSLRDPAHDPGPQRRHTCEVVAMIDADAFKQWERNGMKKGEPSSARSESYLAFKDQIERQLLAQFAEHFPRVAALVKFHEASTPISVETYTGAEHGAMYGLEATPKRFFCDALRPRTPIGGLLLAGQDVASPGVTGAFMGGVMAAASVEKKLWELLR